MLEVYDRLFGKLFQAGVTFCNWKGHADLEQQLNGYGDIDLFIPEDSKLLFENLAFSTGFRRVRSFQASHDYLEHYYALDTETQRFAHIHVYYRIVTGEHASKNYSLPLDNYLLANIEKSEGIPSLTADVKYTIFLLRYYLKIGSAYGLFQFWREIGKFAREQATFSTADCPVEIEELGLSSQMFFDMHSAFKK